MVYFPKVRFTMKDCYHRLGVEKPIKVSESPKYYIFKMRNRRNLTKVYRKHNNGIVSVYEKEHDPNV